jgi:phage terminase large subunit-like protein
LDELKKEKSKKFPYRFDRDLAERACEFIQLLPHTKGEWAYKRMLITLEPWQLFIIACVFGWIKKKDRLRRFREVYTEIARKNGKSAISAGVGLLMFVADGECGAEVYSGATTEKQSWEVFRPSRLMCKKRPDMCEHFGIQVNAKSLIRLEDNARFEALIGDPGDGASPSCALIDEYHEHVDNRLVDTMLSGMGARLQGLIWYITTAGSDIEGPCYDKRRAVIEMLEGTTPDDELFGVIYTLDESDDWTDPNVLVKANPNIGVSVYRDYLISQQNRAIKNARLANTFKTKHCNVWVTSQSAFFNMEDWNSCEDESLTLDLFEGQDCILGMDLARKKDLVCMARLFWRDIDGKRHYYSVSPGFWVPEDTAMDNDNRRMAERLQKWVNTEDLFLCQGAEVDYRDILDEATKANQNHCVIECPLDPHGATNLGHHLDDEGLEPITIQQNYTNLSDPMKELEAAISAGRFHHDGNPIMSWCVSNVVGKHIAGNDDVVRPIKEGVDNKIDGAVALIMAIGRVMVAQDNFSVYEKEGLLFL